MKTFNRLAYFTISSYLFFIFFLPITISHASNDKCLKVGVQKHNYLLSFIDGNDKTPKGFSVDLVKMLATKMGSSVVFYTINDSDLIKALDVGEIDIAVGIMDKSYSKTNIIRTSVQTDRKLFINRHCLSVSSYNDLPGHILAIEVGRDLSWVFPSPLDIDIIEALSQEDALSLVDSGKAHVYISNNNVSTTYIIKKEGFKNIKEVALPIDTVPLVLAVNKSNPELLTSLSIAYGNILEEKGYHRLYYKWLGNDAKVILARYKNYITGIMAIIILVILLSFLWNAMLKKKVLSVTKDLLISEQKYRDLIESSPDIIHLLSLEGEIRLANNMAMQHLEYNQEEMTSLRLDDLVLPEQAKDVKNFIGRAYRSKYSNKEFTLVAKNGRRINAEMIATILKKADNSENLVCCFSRDLTERKRLEEELIHSDRLAVIGRMAAGIAHEINNPLWIILSNTEDMLSHNLSKDEMQQCLKSIERNGFRAAKTIEDLLKFARPSPIRIEDIDLVKLVDDCLIFLKQKLKKKSICIEKQYSSESIFFQCDENLIQQLFINIILNAIHAIDIYGLIRISVNLNEIIDGGKIFVAIKDNGKGIPERKLKYIFNPFYTFGKNNGFGLGLFMSKIIVDKHNGDLSVKSLPGKGTTISICFPIKTNILLPPQEPIFKESVHE